MLSYWYSPVLPTELGFPQSCRKILTNFILSLSTNLSRKRPADSFIEFTTNSSSIVIVFLNELSAALSSSPNSAAPDAVQTYLRMKPQCNLASIMDQKHQQRKLQMVADDILESYLDPSVYRTPVTRVFLQKILAHVVLEMTIEKCSRAEWINEWIVYLLEEGEPSLGRELEEVCSILSASSRCSNCSSSRRQTSSQGRQCFRPPPFGVLGWSGAGSMLSPEAYGRRAGSGKGELIEGNCITTKSEKWGILGCTSQVPSLISYVCRRPYSIMAVLEHEAPFIN